MCILNKGVVEMKKETKIALASVGAAAVASAVTATLLSAVKLLSDMAVKKEIPKVLRTAKINISGSNPPDDGLVEFATEKALYLKDVCTEKVTIKNRDGLTLTGYWYRHENPKRIIIAMHGWRSSWVTDFSLIAEFLHEQGCSVLFPDQRAHGESQGEHIGFGVFERYDCVDWLEYVLETEQTDIPVYLCGISMGATTVLMASELDLPPRVKGIISDCGFTSPNDIWRHVMNNNLKIKGNLALNIANFYVSRQANFDAKSISTVNCVANTKTPILFVHGTSDSFVPVDMTKENYEACASEKQLLTVDGADHGLSFYVDPETYKKTVIEFFEKYDER